MLRCCAELHADVHESAVETVQDWAKAEGVCEEPEKL